MEQSKVDFKKLRSKIHLLYGLDLDETTLAILSVLLLEMRRELNKSSQAQEKMLRDQTKAAQLLQADPGRPLLQAFFYGLGQWGLALCMLVILAGALSVLGLKNKIKGEQNLIRELSWYKKYYEETGQKETSKALKFIKEHPQPQKESGNE